MATWTYTVEECPNGSGLLLAGVAVWWNGAHRETTDAGGQFETSDPTFEGALVSLVKPGYHVGNLFPPPGGGTYSTCLTATGGGGGGGGAVIPADPSDLTATALSDTEIGLEWADHSDDELGFLIERSPDGADWSEIATVAEDVTTHTDTGLTPETTYYYRVAAVAGGGNSGYTNVASATTFPGPPGAPLNCAAEGVSASRVRVTWEEGGGDESGFEVQRSPDGSAGWVTVGATAANRLFFHDTGLAPETTYHYRVRALSGAGPSGWSNTASATTLAVGLGECANEPYAAVADVQGFLWSGNLAISDSTEPDTAQVEDWLCAASELLDSWFAWRYVVPVTHPEDRVRLRVPCAQLVAAWCWEVLKTRNPGHTERDRDLRASAFSLIGLHPGGVGTWLRGGSAVILGRESERMGRALLVLPHTPEAAGTPASRTSTPRSTFREPGEDGEPPRLFRRTHPL